MTDIAEIPQDVLAPRPGPGRPVLPDWRTAWANTKYWLRWTLLFHVIRLPWYWLILMALRGPVGLWRFGQRRVEAIRDKPGETARTTIAMKQDVNGNEVATVSREHRNARREAIFWTFLVCAIVGVLGYLFIHTWRDIALATLGTLTLFGFLGRSPDHPVRSNAGKAAPVPKLTQDFIRAALESVSIGKLKGDQIHFVTPVARVGRVGWRVDIDLPAGVTAGDVCAKRGAIASALRRPLSCVWPEGDPDVHEARLILYVADNAMNKDEPLEWSLAKAGKVDWFEEFPIGVDPRGDVVSLCLMYANMIIGALPGMGKTALMRLILLAASLDPTVELHIHDHKGGSDYNSLKPVAHRFRTGIEDDDFLYLLQDLRDLTAELDRRYKVLRDLPHDVCPDAKVTRRLANDPRLRLYPILFAHDECQKAYEHPTYGKDIERMVSDVTRRGRGAAMSVLDATQRIDVGSIPSNISTNAALRYCGRVMRQIENDMLLGPGAHSSGTTATTFSKKDVGIGYVVGEEDDPVITRCAYVDVPTAERIVVRAKAAREAAGTLSGYALGQDQGPQDADAKDSILEHLAAVWPGEETKVHCSVLAARLVHRFPDVYPEGMTATDVTNAVKPYGLRSQQVKREGVDGIVRNLNGLVRADLTAALGGREAARELVAAPQDSPLPGSGEVDTPLPAPLPDSEHESAA